MKVKDLIKNSVWMPSSNYCDIRPPEISIFMPTYRRFEGGHFERCVDSLLAQSFTDFELIIIDDFSYDGTFNRVKTYMEQDSRVSCIRHTQNIGLPAISEYEAFCRSRGKYLGFAFDDCMFESRAFEILLNALKEAGEKVVCGNGYIDLLDGQKLYLGSQGMVAHEIGLEHIHLANFLPNAAFLIAREVFESVGHYDPHISLLRLCDWDLWQRILKKYNIHLIDEVVVQETSLSDSLGNAFTLDYHAAKVQMYRDRTVALSTENFPEYDVVAPVGLRSMLSLDSYTGYYKENFGSRSWFVPFEIEQANIDAPGDICIVTNHFNASTQLCFKPTTNTEYNVLIIPPLGGNKTDSLYYTGAAIIVRDLWMDCNNISVPTYYFIDDVFSEINDPMYKIFSLDNIRKRLKHFHGVLASTPAIAEYYLQNKLHENCIVYPAIYRTDIFVYPHHKDAVITCLFQGGKWRKDIFVNVVYPALENLSKKHVIRLVCPDFVIENLPTAPFEVISIKSTYDYERFIQNISQYDVDIVLHPAPVSTNNRFKEVNALLNASLVGAVLVATDDEPYTRIPENCVELCASTSSAWEECIQDLIENPKRMESLLQNAQAYCLKHHSGQRNKAVLDELSGKHPMPSFYEYRKRLANYIQINNGSEQNRVEKLATVLTRHGYWAAFKLIAKFVVKKFLKVNSS